MDSLVRRFLQPQGSIGEVELIQQYRHRQFPAGNPLANALVIVVGALVIALSFVVGVVALAAFIAAGIVMAAFIGIRIWWLNRKLGAGRKSGANQARPQQAKNDIIEGEFRVVEHHGDRDATR